ncbi:T3SS effector HopA1 family protein [uncultured Lacinutrix sp.]|uniref:T3SS effector HopA1 family protein n=1 Tax=uncultured Lacinutrix sp. TaxID=574032 RepID=UPI0026067310|nr:T3SS effector HopA1 family protein [uncultured Lacinutrix sp.]
MFKDDVIVKELVRINSQLDISKFNIAFRGQNYEITSQNVLSKLVRVLYSECYALKDTYQKGEVNKYNGVIDLDEIYVSLLSKNNYTKDKTQDGWLVKRNLSNGFFEVAKELNVRTIYQTELRPKEKILTTKVGDMVSLFFPREEKYKQPTFYYVNSNQIIDFNKMMTRIYWNINDKGAPVLIEKITKKLNHYNIPFLFKCLNNPKLYFRRDAAVLYIENKNMQVVKLLLPELCGLMESYLDEDVPLFTYRYSKGVGIAESPSIHESFGMNRITTVAETILNNIGKKLDSNAMLNNISNAFIKKGINPEKPFLNSGSQLF